MEEEIVNFKALTDRINFEIQDPKSMENMLIISGYDLDIEFNADLLKSVESIESCLEGVKSLFRELIMEQLLKTKTE